MDRKKVARYSAAGAIILVVAAVVFFIYRRSSNSVSLPSQYEVAEAVPVDAAAVLFSGSFDRTSVLLGPKSQISRFFAAVSQSSNLHSALKDTKPVVSWHFSGKLVPLMVLADMSSPEDSLVLKLQDAVGKGVLVEGSSVGDINVILVSPSRELVNSSKRHSREGVSVLSRPGFDKAARSLSSESFALLSGEYIIRIAPQLKGFADWTVLSLDGKGDDFTLDGCFVGGDDSASLSGMMSRVGESRFSFADVVPASTSYAIAVSLSGYRKAYEDYLLSTSLLTRNKQTLSDMSRKTKIDVLSWAAPMEELVSVNWKKGKTRRNAILLRSSEATGVKSLQTDQTASFIPVLYGNGFAPSGSYVLPLGKYWLAYGDKATLEELQAMIAAGDVLAQKLEENHCEGVIPSAAAVVYDALNVDNASLFGRGLDAHVAAFAGKSALAPLVVSFNNGNIRVRALRCESPTE